MSEIVQEGRSRRRTLLMLLFAGCLLALLIVSMLSLFGHRAAGLVSQPTNTCKKCLSTELLFGRLMLSIGVVILAARGVGAVLGRVGQPRVMGEVLAGVLLGPTLLQHLGHGQVSSYLFPDQIVPLMKAGADVGLAFYMFLVGLEFDPRALRGRAGDAVLISNASVALPFALGLLAARPIHSQIASSKPFTPFAVFIGVSMSITAFPVLARILVERRMLNRPVGTIVLASAAIDDVTAWGLLALATAIAANKSAGHAGVVVVSTAAFAAAMIVVGRPLLARVSVAYDEAGHVPAGWITAIFTGVLLSAYAAANLGVAAIFGAFVMGAIMPRRSDLTHDISKRLEDFVGTVLLPLFFVTAGLSADIGALKTSKLWFIALLLLGVAVVGKFLGASIAGALVGYSKREAAAIGILMNTRGLTELIVLKVGLDANVITHDLYTMLVMMALVTTFMAGPVLRLLDPHGRLSAPPEEELEAAQAMPQRGTILIAPQDQKNIDALMAIAEPLARTSPPRDVLLVRIASPPRSVSFVSAQDRSLAEESAIVEQKRKALIAKGMQARGVAFTSPSPGEDLVRLARDENVDLLLLEGRRPLLGSGIPRGAVGTVLEDAQSDVAVLVERGHIPLIGPDRPVVVPFGGADHDWAALDIGAWIAKERGAVLRLLGAASTDDTARDASRLLAAASLAVQQLVGIAAEPVMISPGGDAVVAAGEDAGLIVVGLAERWRMTGVGAVRADIARRAIAPVLLVRRGPRASELTPGTALTRFTWSRPARVGGTAPPDQAPGTRPQL